MNAPLRDENVLRATILTHAARLFAEQGYSATSIRQVTDACECTKPALYYYFKSKEALFAELISIEVVAVSRLTERLLDAPGNIRERLRNTIDAFVDRFERDPLGMQLMQRIEMNVEEGMPTIECPCGQEMHLGALEELVRQGIARGELKADLDVETAALLLTGATRFHFQRAMAGHPLSRKKLFTTVELILDGIGIQ